jgi:hypothetical protein
VFRCHFTRAGHIVTGENLESATLDEAKATAEKILTERAASEHLDGFEIWDGAMLLYTSRSVEQGSALC